MNNQEFLVTISKSLIKFLNTHARSNEKLKILHGSIAADLSKKLSNEFSIKSLGFKEGKEGTIKGKYNDKNVDILLLKKSRMIGAIAVKFVMNNYSQNSNNYFENMIGETANIRSSGFSYYQVLVIPSEIPYFEKNGVIKKWENVSDQQIEKYILLQSENISQIKHAPNKLLFYIVDFPSINRAVIKNKDQYTNYLLNLQNDNKFKILDLNFYSRFNNIPTNMYCNNYEKFIDDIVNELSKP